MPPAAPAAWPQATLGQLGQHGRVVGSRDQRVQHRPAGGAQHVAGDRAQLDPGVLQDLGQPLGLTGPLAGQRRAVAGQIAQLPDRLGRHEPGSDQAVRNQLTDPHRVGHIGLGPGHGAQGRHSAASTGSRLPAGRTPAASPPRWTPSDHGHAKAGQPITQQHQPCRGRPKRPRLLQPTPAGSGTPTVAVTLALSTSRPAQRSMSRSMAAPSRGRRQHNRPEEPQHAESEVRAPSNSPGVPEAPASSS